MEENNLNNYQPSSNQKSSNMGLGVIVGILICLVLALGGFIVYDKFIKEDKTESDKTQQPQNTSTPVDKEEKTELSVDDPIVQKLYGIFSYEGNCYEVGEVFNTSNAMRLWLAYNNLSVNDISEMSCSTLEPTIKSKSGIFNGYCGITTLTDEMLKYFGNDDAKFNELVKSNVTKYFKESKLREKYLELFGTNYTYKAEDFDGSVSESGALCAPYHYVKEKGIYAKYNGECGGICAAQKQTINSAYKENGKLYIKTTLVSDYDNTKKSVDYEFKLENGNYTFVKVVEKNI